jgi:hypothetical protein
MWSDDLARLLGYEAERVGMGDDPKAALPGVLARIKEEIRAGRPVLVWNALTLAEYDVVCGFDEEKHELIGRGSYKGMDGYASASESRPTGQDVAPALGAIFIGRRTGTFEARAAEVAALREAAAHARGMSRTLTGLPTGLACYDSWVGAYENRGALVKARSRDGKTDLGFVASGTPDDFYPLTIWPSTRQAAADFLREIAPKYPETRVHLEVAAEHFAREAAALEGCRDALGDRSKEPTDEQCLRAAGRLREARAMYELGIEEIERAVGRIGG